MTISTGLDHGTPRAARYPRHEESSAFVAAPPEPIFEHLDDQRRLGEHMGESSMMMGGGSMTYNLDEGGGRAVGSHIRMVGVAFGLKLDLDEVVTVREPPAHKAWRTVGQPNLLVVGGYEMGFDLRPEGSGSRLTVWIDYELPARGFGRWLPFLGRMYARWCVEQMTNDARDAFAPKPT